MTRLVPPVSLSPYDQPLNVAGRSSILDCINILLDVNSRDDCEDTPVITAAYFNQLSLTLKTPKRERRRRILISR